MNKIAKRLFKTADHRQGELDFKRGGIFYDTNFDSVVTADKFMRSTDFKNFYSALKTFEVHRKEEISDEINDLEDINESANLLIAYLKDIILNNEALLYNISHDKHEWK